MTPEPQPGRPWSLADADYDVVIVGGGMAGAGAARDLALRGLSVALVEKGDFASATTARSSKLIHGGLRYLELFDFGLVRESLAERERLGRLAPHLVRPLPFLVPIYRESSRGLIKVRIGLALYNWLTPGRNRERYRVLKSVDALSLEPGIRPDDLRGAGYYFDDLLLYPERLCLENVLSACRHGARAFNYAQVEEVRSDAGGRPNGVRVRDLLTGTVATLGARVIVNASGPWVDDLRALAGVRDRGAHVLRRTKGIHCLLPRMTERAIYHSTRDDRMIFVIPWREFSLVGTTDTDFDGDLDRVHATREEVDYLLAEVRHAVPDPRVVAGEVFYTYAGVRPLSFEEGGRASDVSRAHKVVEEAGGRFLSITGTKLTCFRSLAEELGDRVCRVLGRPAPSRTARLTLDGADEEVGRVEAHTWLDVSDDVAAGGLPRETLEALVSLYGRNYRRVMELAGKVTGGAERLCPSNPDVVAQLHHAVHEELTVSLQDFLLRRTGIGTSRCQGGDCAEGIARRLAPLLGWSGRRVDAELEAFQAHVARSQRFPDMIGAPRRLALTVVVTGALLVAGAGVGRAADDLRTIPSRPGVTQSFLLVRPAGRATAAVVLFAGGNGALKLDSGRLGLGGNFLVRNRARFAEHGLLVAVIDAPSDRPDGLDGFRTTTAHADDVSAVIAALRAEAAVPVWLVGTSMGTVSAASAAARLGAGGPDGLVLTSTVTRQGRERRESVGDVRLKDIRVPTLVVHHREDACRATPYADTVGLLRDLAATPRRELLTFDGGAPPQSGPCDARAPHGFFGIDAEVVAAIARWITSGARP